MSARLEVADVNRFCNAALECDRFADLQAHVLTTFETLFQCDSCMFYPRLGSAWDRDLSQFGSRGIAPDFVARYVDDYYQDDPFAEHIRDPRESPPWRVSRSTDLVDYGRLVQGRFYNDFLRPNGTHYLLTMVLAVQGRQIGHAMAARGPNRPNFSAEDLQKAELIFPTLVAVLDRSMQRERHDAQSRALGAVCLDLFGRPIVILDSDFSPIVVNPQAEALLRQVLVPEHRGTASMPQNIIDACHALAIPNTGSTPQDVHLLLDCVEHSRAPIPAYIERHNGPGGPLFLVMLGQSSSGSDLTDHMNRLGLTKREMDVALLVVRGRTTADIASALCRSVNTVESHLKSIFRKANVTSRAELFLTLRPASIRYR
jgi:DNA-binding CsgD family transcriptional regulator